MGRVLVEDTLDSAPNVGKTYHEPNSVHLADDWNTSMEEFIDDFDDYQDLNLPGMDDEY
ncbi:MAG: hypothetical protein L3J01_05375 [Thiomicrorhabdus sp.]|nr:hypothetical protein [Thiomicrorhabdus sp.]